MKTLQLKEVHYSIKFDPDFDRDFYNNVLNIKTYKIKQLEKDQVYPLNIYWVYMVISIVAMLAYTYQTDQMLCSAKCRTSGMLCV